MAKRRGFLHSTVPTCVPAPVPCGRSHITDRHQTVTGENLTDRNFGECESFANRIWVDCPKCGCLVEEGVACDEIAGGCPGLEFGA